MASKKYRLLEEGIDRGWMDGEPGTEVELDLGDSEKAIIAAGWAEPADEPKKGGKK